MVRGMVWMSPVSPPHAATAAWRGTRGVAVPVAVIKRGWRSDV